MTTLLDLVRDLRRCEQEGRDIPASLLRNLLTSDLTRVRSLMLVPADEWEAFENVYTLLNHNGAHEHDDLPMADTFSPRENFWIGYPDNYPTSKIHLLGSDDDPDNADITVCGHRVKNHWRREYRVFTEQPFSIEEEPLLGDRYLCTTCYWNQTNPEQSSRFRSLPWEDS